MDPALLAQASSMVPTPFNLVESIGQAFQQKNQQRYNRQMYELQRDDAIKFWGLQNDYNSPTSQVARLKSAGLNPAFAYGGANTGGSIQVPDIAPSSFRDPKVEGGPRLDPLLSADLRIKNAQANNLETQSYVLKQELALKELATRRGQFDLDFLTETRPFDADFHRERLRGLTTQIDLSINKDAREAAQLSTNVAEAVSRMESLLVGRAKSQVEIAQIRVHTDNLRKEGKIKDWEVMLTKNNINPHDPMWARMLGSLLAKGFGLPDEKPDAPGYYKGEKLGAFPRPNSFTAPTHPRRN